MNKSSENPENESGEDNPTFRDRLSLILFICSILFFVYMLGFLGREKEWFPYEILTASHKQLLSSARTHFLHDIKYPNSGVTTYDKEAMSPGLTLLTTHEKDLGWVAALILIDSDGNKLHTWEADALKIWPVSPHDDWRAGVRNGPDAYIHGAHLFENGDVLFNIAMLGLVRMNAKGEVIWKLPQRTHHSIFRNEDGDFWVCNLIWREDNPEGRERAKKFPGIEFPFVDDYLMKVSPEGKVLQEISVLEILYEHGHDLLLWKFRQDELIDPVHINDIEELSTELADEYPLFEKGDLLFSMRNINTICVVDPDTKRVKFITSEPFVRQHDPDFLGDGKIGIFDNGDDGTSDGTRNERSRIISIDPAKNETQVLYETREKPHFYTHIMGKFQQAENGNLLITEAIAGRVFEVNKDGKVLWEWIQEPYNGSLVSEVTEGTRYPFTKEQVAAWSELKKTD